MDPLSRSPAPAQEDPEQRIGACSRDDILTIKTLDQVVKNGAGSDVIIALHTFAGIQLVNFNLIRCGFG